MQALIIDDARIMRMLLRSALEKLGFQVHEAKNGREGLTCLSGLRDVDVVMVDWHMPEMTGLEFVQQVRARPCWVDLPIIMVTAEQSPADIQRARDAGASDTLGKPFTVEVIREKLSFLGVSACPS